MGTWKRLVKPAWADTVRKVVAVAAADRSRAGSTGRCAGCIALVWAFVVGLTVSARADDRVIVRGNYYREESTRVLQPMVSFTKDFADHRVQVGVDYLLDSISSASIAAGAEALGGDIVFTEFRHEAGAHVAGTIGAWQLGASYRYSSETDYVSNTASVSLARNFFDETMRLSLSYTTSLNRVYKIRNNVGDRLDHMGYSGDTNLYHVHHLNFGYSQILTRVWLGGAGVEANYGEGPQDNPYRRVLNGEQENHPWTRLRLVGNLWSNIAIPRARMVIEPRYRFYGDSWGVRAHAIDLRLHVRLWQWLRVRLRYRYYNQTEADFLPDPELGIAPDAEHWTADPKLARFDSHTPGLELTWELDGLAGRIGLDWLQGAWIQATYNHVFQTSSFGPARLGSLAFSLPF